MLNNQTNLPKLKEQSNIMPNAQKYGIIHFMHKNLFCVGLKIKLHHSFSVNNIDMFVHNEFKITIDYDEKKQIKIKIRENEKVKVVSDASNGLMIVSEAVMCYDDENVSLSYDLTVALMLADLSETLQNQEVFDLLSNNITCAKRLIDESKSQDNYFLFDLT